MAQKVTKFGNSPIKGHGRYAGRMRTVGMLIREVMRKKALNQKQFAALVGMTPATISRIIDGKRKLHLKRVERWVASLRLSKADSRRMVIAVYLSNAPREVRNWIAALERKAAAAQRKL